MRLSEIINQRLRQPGANLTGLGERLGGVGATGNLAYKENFPSLQLW